MVEGVGLVEQEAPDLGVLWYYLARYSRSVVRSVAVCTVCTYPKYS